MSGGRKPGTCLKCGKLTSRTQYRYCHKCKPNVTAGDALPQPAALPTSKIVDSFTAEGDRAEVGKMTPTHVRTLADLIAVCEIDTNEWLVERWVANKWEMGSKDPDGKPVTTPLFQVKAWLKRNRPLIEARSEIVALIADAKKALPPPPKVVPTSSGKGFMLELNIADLHNGKLAWSRETGHGNYDSKTAEAAHDLAVSTLLTRCSGYPLEEIVLVVGNDMIHVDSRGNTTTAGTAQDTDSRYYKLFLSTRQMVTRMIERCRRVAPVRVVMVPGNHDRDSVWHLGDSLSCLYHQCKGVVVDNEPRQRKYVEFGKVMLLLTHGHQAKREDYPLLMATEQPEMFGRTLYREAHTGHLHQTRVQEYHGVRVRILPALSGIDAWHAENGFVGNIRAAEAFVWSHAEGLVATAYHNISPFSAADAIKLAERDQC